MIRVASYNIRKSVGLDYRRDAPRVLSVLAAIGADVVALQETDRRFGSRASSIPHALIAEITDLKPVALSPRAQSMGWHGNAILVRRDTKVQAVRRLDLPGTEPRGAAVVDLELPTALLRVVGVHLGLFRRDRRAQVSHIAGFLESLPDMPTLIMGDFNEWHRKDQNLNALNGRYTLHTPGKSFPTLRPVVGLDKFALSHDLCIESGGVHDCHAARRASDHKPIWADISAA